jgi:hypothetical protein
LLRDLLNPDTFKPSQDDPRPKAFPVLVGAAIRSTPQLTSHLIGRGKYLHGTCYCPIPLAFALLGLYEAI